MKKEYNHDELFLLKWENGKDLEVTRLKVTRRVRVFLADTDEEYDLITAIDDIGRRYSNLEPGLYINKDNIVYTYRIDHWEYRTRQELLTREELKERLNKMEAEYSDMLNAIFKVKFDIERLKSLYCH